MEDTLSAFDTLLRTDDVRELERASDYASESVSSPM